MSAGPASASGNDPVSGTASLHLTPLTRAVGARVDGVDLSGPLDPEVAATVRAALFEHVVLVIGGQDLSAEGQIAFTEHIGPPVPHPLSARPGMDPEGLCIVFENRPGQRGARNDFWHSDISCATRPPAVSILHAVQVPAGRGDTLFCNMYEAWEHLSPGLKAMLAPLTAVHDGAALLSRNRQADTDSPPDLDVPPPSTHPVVRRHPETGRAALYTNTFFTKHFTGMTARESRPLLELIEEIATEPDNVYRHRWQPGDVVMWDNRCAMHYAHYDYEPDEPRRMHRTTAGGERPMSAFSV